MRACAPLHERGVDSTHGSRKSQKWRNGLVSCGFSGCGQGGVDPCGDPWLSFQALLYTSRTMNRAGRNEADIQAPQPQAGEQARIPRSHEDRRGAQDAQSPSQAWARPDRRRDRREIVGATSGRAEAFPREARIRLGSEIRALLERGKRKRTRSLDVFFGASPVSHSRVGLVVPKHGQRVVDRNLLKRRLREILRREVLRLLPEGERSVDLLIRARRSAYEVGFAGLRDELVGTVEDECSPGL